MRKFFSGKFILMLWVILMITAFAGSSGFAATAADTTCLVVKLVPGLTGTQQAAVIARDGGVETSSIPPLRLHIISVPTADLPLVLPGYQADPQVERVEVNQTRKAEAAPSDANYGVQWTLPKIGWDSVYGAVTPTGSATVALLDTGVDATHPDLAGVVVAGTSILDGSNGLTDTNGHGTFLAGIVAALTDNGTGIAGVAYRGVKIMPVSVLGADGTGQDSNIIAGIVWAADHGANVILMGFSNPNFSQNLQDAIDYAWSKGVVLVAATGNDGVSTSTFPAGDRGVVGVSATDETDLLASGSNYGLDTFLAAPGTNIFTTSLGGTYTYISGTSASSAVVAGVAGFMKAVDPTLANGVIVGRLAKSADAIGTAGDPNNQTMFGNGRVNMANAVADTSTDIIQPSGAAPVGNGGPYVGPYVAATTSVAPATGGTSISADTAKIGGNGTFTSLTGPSIVENKTKDIPAGSVILNAPAGFEFDTTADSVTVTVSGTAPLAQINTSNTTVGQATTKTVTPTATQITIWITAASSGSGKSTFTWSGIKVRPIDGTPLESGDITSSGTCTGVPSGTNMGTLREVAGSATTLIVSGISSPVAAGTASNVTVTAKDAYGNIATGYTGTVHFTSTDSQAVLPANYTFLTGDAGTHTFTSAVTLKTAGGQSVTATDTVTGTLTGTQTGITVNSAALDHFAISTVSSPQTALSSFSITITAQNASNSTETSFTGTVDLSVSGGSTISPTTTGSFTGGVWTGNVTVSGAGNGRTIIATRTAGTETGTSNLFNVDKATPTATLAVNNTPQNYSGSAQAATVNITASSVLGSVANVLTGGAATQTNANTYAVTADFVPTDTTNYNTLTGLSAGSFVIDKANPSVTTWPTASTITYGQALASSTLSGGAATPPGSFAFTTPATAPNAGTASQSVTYTPTDATNYNSATGSASVTVDKANPSVTAWPTASAITYGQTLASSTLSGGTATPAGSFAFTTPLTAPNAGTASQSVTFIPTDTANYNMATGSASVTVDKANPSVTAWPTASAITYGQTLASSTLSGGTATAAGSFAFTTPSTAPNAGTASQSVTFIPTDTANYNTATGSASVTVSKATPIISAWPTPSGLTYGQALSASTLTGGTGSVGGSFAYDAPTTVPGAGSYSATVTFTPTDTNYNPVSGTVNVAVAKVTPTVSAWPTASGLTYEQTLSASTLTGGTGSVDGTFAFTAPSTVPGAGSYSAAVTFTPADTNYNPVSGMVNVAVAKATPTISAWPTASGLTYGQALSASTLTGGTGSVGGSFAFATPSTVPGAGSYSAAATFTPTDATNYNTVSGFISVTVVAGGLDHLAVSTMGSPQTAGTPFTITITAQDAGNNTITSFTGTVNLTTTDGTINPATTAVFVDGVWTGNVTVTGAGTGQKITAMDPTSSKTGESGAFDVNPGAAVAFSVSAQPIVSAGVAFNVTVTAKDSYNNTAISYAGTVHFTSTDAHTGIMVPADYTFVGSDNGSHTFAAGVALETAGPQTVTATDTTTSSITGTSGGISVNPAGAAKLLVTAPPTATAGTPFPITVTVKDTYDNTITDYTGTVHFTGSNSQAVFPTDYTFVAGDNGSHSFVTTLRTAASQTVTAADTVTSSINGTSGSIEVGYASANKLTFGQQPVTTMAGQAIAPALTVRVEDQYSNLVTASTAAITVAIGTNPGSGILAGTTTQTAVNGIATFDDLSIDAAASGYKLTAASDSMTTATSAAFDITGGALHHFEISTIGTQTAGSPFNITITARDASNNTIAFTGTVDLNVSGGSSITPTTTMNFIGGTWTGSVTVTVAGSSRAITATQSGGLESGPSNTFDVNKADSNVTAWPSASAITYGQTLASSTLSGGTATAAGNFAFTTPLTAPNAGTAPQSVTFTPADPGNYNTATGSASVTVNKANQSINFTAISSKNTNDPPFTLNATASSGLQVSFSIVSGPATINGNMVTLTGTTGTIVVRASQAGDGDYNAAANADQSIIVTQSTALTCRAPSAILVPASNTTGKIHVSWGVSNVTGVSYVLEYSKDGWASISQGYSGTQNSANIVVTANGNYTFRVKAFKTGYVESSYTVSGNDCAVTLTCGAPASIYAPASDNTGRIHVSWGVSDVAGVSYVLEYSKDGWASSNQGYRGTQNSANISATGPAGNGTYRFRVKATKPGYSESSYIYSGDCIENHP